MIELPDAHKKERRPLSPPLSLSLSLSLSVCLSVCLSSINIDTQAYLSFIICEYSSNFIFPNFELSERHTLGSF